MKRVTENRLAFGHSLCLFYPEALVRFPSISIYRTAHRLRVRAIRWKCFRPESRRPGVRTNCRRPHRAGVSHQWDVDDRSKQNLLSGLLPSLTKIFIRTATFLYFSSLRMTYSTTYCVLWIVSRNIFLLLIDIVLRLLACYQKSFFSFDRESGK